MNTFLFSLKVMGIGLIGIFSVTIVLIIAMVILTRLFPVSAEKQDEESK
ncbi:MAG: hypothetical protein PUC46_04890 [Lachnospiraceae bacterium]|nr:hypothetical protein [Lachnospiraceae bacterium]